MNKRQAKKKETLIQLGMDWGFWHIPKYKEIKAIERSYHEYCVRSYRTEKKDKRSIFECVFFSK